MHTQDAFLHLGADVTTDLRAAERREWLVTDGRGGYASGTVAGLPTRRYHGLLIAALDPPLGRTVLVHKVDEAATYAGRSVALGATRWQSGAVDPAGFRYLRAFRLEGTTPVWTYAFGDAVLEKRVWMEPGASTTYVRYRLLRGSARLALALKVLVTCRDHHMLARAGDVSMQAEAVAGGLCVVPSGGGVPVYLRCAGGAATPQHQWYYGVDLRVEARRGMDHVEDHLHAGTVEGTLAPGEALTHACSTDARADLDGDAAWRRRRAYEDDLREQAALSDALSDAPPAVRHLVLAADQFMVHRATEAQPDGKTILAGYPWFSDWGRDAMIALPGLTLATGRPAVAATVLRTFARYVERGMLPNRFPDAGDVPDYNTVDATLWFFEAVRACHAATGDDALLRDLFPVLQDVVAWHREGTRFQIRVDPSDGLLAAGTPGVQLTWMDAKVDGWVVTPRIGKPVEVNALWYHALRCMAAFARHLGAPAGPYETAAERVQAHFGRFWNEAGGYCFDVIDGPDGDDPALRPNQLLAVALPHSPLTPAQQQGVVRRCARHLLTPVGLRSLAPDHPDYVPRYRGDRHARDGAYHQGTAWSWLLGPFVQAHLRVYGDPGAARSFLDPLLEHLYDHGLGSISEIFDGDPPHTPRGCIAQAWGVAEVLRAWTLTR